MQYRREIDGLRAVAVLPVILYHAQFSIFSGGYIGVDVFFVISGYLITSILIGELEQGKFSIARFYERRARRILPALFFVMLCCIPFAWMWMLPTELKDFSQSVVAVVFFASNILFWREEGYFAPAAELKPLLHTWSLAVEEQYYLLFPIFLLLAWRFGRNRVFLSICVIAAISLAASEWGWRNKPSANFYLAPTRAWELLTGSICAFWLSGREQRVNNSLSLLGLAMIIFAIFYYDGSTPFPSVYALIPVLGTALIIVFGGTGTWTAKLLSMPGFVGIGLISYSAYLWHQPLFAFARIRSILEPSPYLMAALAALSLMMAYFSWRFIEKPFRNGQASTLSSRRAVFAVSGAVAAVFLIIGLIGHQENGFSSRFPDEAKAYLNGSQDVGKYMNECLNGPKVEENWVSVKCNIGRKNGDIDFVLFGDSYAGAIADGLDEAALAENKRGILLGLHSCTPVIGAGGWWNQTKAACVPFQNAMLHVVRRLKPRIVILHARWSAFEKTEFIKDNSNTAETGYDAFNSKMISTVAAFKREGIAVYVVCCTPQALGEVDVPKSLAKSYLFSSGLDLRESRGNLHSRNMSAMRIFRSDTFKRYASFVDISEAYCGLEKCEIVRGSQPLIYDYGHLSRSGALLSVPILRRRILSQPSDDVR